MRPLRKISRHHCTSLHPPNHVKYMNLPSCRNCIHYNPSILHADFTSTHGTCSKYGEKNIITNKITYISADVCRYDTSKCGIEGKYFELEPHLDKKMTAHFAITISPCIFFIAYIGFLHWIA